MCKGEGKAGGAREGRDVLDVPILSWHVNHFLCLRYLGA